MTAVPFHSSPVIAARDLQLKLIDRNDPEPVSITYVNVVSSDARVVDAASEHLCDLGALPERMATFLDKALLLIGSNQKQAAIDLLVDARAEAQRLAERGELEGL